jgi:lipoprotein-anchoring transpeptidase ErfK/SrfK
MIPKSMSSTPIGDGNRFSDKIMRRQMIVRRLCALLVAIVALLAAQPASARELVGMSGGYAPGTIVIVTHTRELFYVLGNNQAIRYPVGVGRAGMAWHGQAVVAKKLLSPAWRAPPELGGGPVIPGGSPRNPMGAAVLGLDHGNYAIHGTNDPASIGGFVSHGCIRMHNEDVLDLYQRAPIGSNVIVLQ